MDVGDWLRSLRLGQYQDAFRENEIDDEILPTLTAQDLKELGVAILAHRRKMLTAMVRFPVASVAVGDFAEVADGRRDAPIPHRWFRRAPATHGDVLRSRRLDRTVGAARSRGHAGSHPHLPGRLFGRSGALRRVRREIQWATAFSPISAFRAPTKRTPNGRSERRWTSQQSPGSSKLAPVRR